MKLVYGNNLYLPLDYKSSGADTNHFLSKTMEEHGIQF